MYSFTGACLKRSLLKKTDKEDNYIEAGISYL